MTGWILIIMLYQSGALSFTYADPKQCREIAQYIRDKQPDRRNYIDCIPAPNASLAVNPNINPCLWNGTMLTCPSGQR